MKVVGKNFKLDKVGEIRNDFSNVYRGQKCVALIDTDSLIGSSLISCSYDGVYTNIKIEDLFDDDNIMVSKDDDTNLISKPKHNCKSLSLNSETGQCEFKTITYVMKHKVKKRMFEISQKNYVSTVLGHAKESDIINWYNKVTVTEDHSVIIRRDDEYISIKPNDIKKSDELIYHAPSSILYKAWHTTDFTVTDLGIQEEWVYDIEVEDNHNFFANNILVHNSNYYQLEPIYNKITNKETFRYILSRFSKEEIAKFKKDTKTNLDIIQLAFVLYHDETVVGPRIDQVLRDFEEEHNTTRNLKWDFEGESEIKTQAVWKKKRYIYETFSGKFTVKGLDVIKTNTSFFIRRELKQLLIDLVANSSKMSIKDNNIYYEERIKEILSQYTDENVFQISNPVGVGDAQWGKWIQNDTPIKGANKNIKALFYFNHMLDMMGEKYDNVDRVTSGKIHVFEVYKSNKFGLTTIGIPFSISERIGLKVLDNFQINYPKQWGAKGEGIIDSTYEVFSFEKNKKQSDIVSDLIFG